MYREASRIRSYLVVYEKHLRLEEQKCPGVRLTATMGCRAVKWDDGCIPSPKQGCFETVSLVVLKRVSIVLALGHP